MAAHTYWRLLFIGQSPANPGTYINISEIEMRATVGGSDQCSGGTATADSQYSSQAPSLAFDNNNSTYWESNNGSTDRWIKYQFASPVDVLEYTIRNGPFAGEGPKYWELQWSDDNSAWTAVHLIGQEAAWSANETRTYAVDTGGASGTLYWRLKITETQTTSDTAVAISEIQMRTVASGSDQCTGGTASASGYSTSGTPVPSNAFDDNNSTIWESETTGGPWWIRYRFSSNKDIVEYTIRSGSFEYPRDWTLEHSGDGVNWTVSDTRSGESGWSSGETRTYSVSSGAVVRPVVCICT